MPVPDTPWTARHPPAPHSLVLFVGLGARPAGELADGLARAGIRGLWLARIEQALAAAAHARFDAAVIQLEGSVSAAAREFDRWRRALDCPLLLLAESLDEVDEIMALELGADGLLAQPVSPRRLRAHVLMLLRRGPLDERHAAPTETLPPAAAGGWVLDRVHNRLHRQDRRVELTEMQAALLQVLMDDAGRVVPRSRLLAAVSRRRVLQPRSVDVYVARLRQRLQDARVAELQLDGVRGRGYALTVLGPATPGWPAVAPAAPVLGWTAPMPDRAPVSAAL